MKSCPTISCDRAAEHFFGRRIDSGHVEILVQLNDRVHGAVNQPAEFFFAFAHLLFRTQATQLGRCARSEDLKQGHSSRLLGHRPLIQNRQMAKNLSVEVQERHTHITRRAHGSDIRSLRIDSP